MRHRVDERVDAEGVAGDGELHEIARVVALPFERVAEVGVVGAEDHDALAGVDDRASVRYLAVEALRGRSAGSPRTDRGDLRELLDGENGVEQEVRDRQVHERVRPGRQHFSELIFPNLPRALAPEV